MRSSVTRLPCGADDLLRARELPHGSRSRVTLYESAPRCGDPGESMTVEHVRIGGKKVAVNVFCKHAGCAGGVKLADGFAHGFLLFLHPGGTEVEVISSHVHLNALLKLARSLKTITRPKGPWPAVHDGEFLSPDGGIWCEMDATQADFAWCVTRAPQHSGELHRDGSVKVCNAPSVCTEGWGDGAPRLHAGQSNVVGPYRCTGAARA